MPGMATHPTSPSHELPTMWTEDSLKNEIRALEELVNSRKPSFSEADGSSEFIRQLLMHRKALLRQLTSEPRESPPSVSEDNTDSG